ncbi:MAG: sigma-70 family RNA polymerase sigma factor [Planctomycetes bacterium]|nr:sigma-70 family RNA polymerase sigma factor [Planctomycetota bacterium]
MEDADDGLRGDLGGYLPEIRRVVSRFGPQRGLTDDIAQECCVRVIEQERLCRRRERTGGWIATVARNLALRGASRVSRERRRSVPLEEGRLPAPLPETSPFSEEQIDWVLSQFASLPERQKEVLKMKYFDGLSTGEVAVRLGVTDATVSTLHGRALASLRARAERRGWLASFLFLPWPGRGKAAAAAAGAAALAGTAYFFTTDPGTHLIVEDSSTLTGTVIAAHPAEAMPRGKNILYCASFQSAWDELKGVAGGDVRLDPDVPVAEFLNRGYVRAGDLPPGSCVAAAGPCDDAFVARVNRMLQETFGEGPDPFLETVPRGDRYLAAYAFLARDLGFAKPFDRLEDPIRFRSGTGEGGGDGVPVRGFGIDGDAGRDAAFQVRVHAEAHAGFDPSVPFVVTLQPSEAGEEIVLARVDPRETLEATIREADALIGLHPADTLGGNLKVPCLDFDLRHVFRGLVGARMRMPDEVAAGPVADPWIIEEARQWIRFRLDERGALLRSRAWVFAERAVTGELIFNRPFLLMLRCKGSERPYFALWVENPEFLVGTE